MCELLAQLRSVILLKSFEGLRRLEYRGYDSAGLAVVDAEGHMTRLRRRVKCRCWPSREEHPHGGGIAHTRWATRRTV